LFRFGGARSRISYDKLNSLLADTNWTPVYQHTNPSLAFDSFFDIFNKCILQSTENVKFELFKHKHLKPWITEKLVFKIKKINILYKKVVKQPQNRGLISYFERFKRNLLADLRETKNNYYHKYFDKCKGDSKKEWEAINKLTGQDVKKNEINELLIGETTITDHFVIANKFNGYFLSVVDTINKDFLNASVNVSMYNKYFSIFRAVKVCFCGL
jgi:hypothetical protein